MKIQKSKTILQKIGVAFVVATVMAISPVPLLAADFIVNNTGDGTDATPGDSICEVTAATGDCTLRAALDEANDANSIDTITFDPATFPAGAGTTIATTSRLDLNAPVTITGPGADSLTVSNDGSSRVFFVDHLAFLAPAGPHAISGMTITGGAGGIHVDHIEAGVTLDSLVVTANVLATNEGGGIRVGNTSVIGQTVSITNSTISGNAAASVVRH